MKIKNFLFVLFAATALVSCNKKNEQQVLGDPSITIKPETLTFEKTGGVQPIEITANREWKANCSESWIAIDPKSGKGDVKAQNVKITLLENTGAERTASIKFTIGFASKTLTITQKGNEATPGAKSDVIYFNNFDKGLISKTGTYWPYLDKTDLWKNATGEGVEGVEYDYYSASLRTKLSYDINSNGVNSDYKGSGMNFLFFGKGGGFFVVKSINLKDTRNYILSFGAIRNIFKRGETIDNTFKPDEFPVYISNDGTKWVKLEYTFPNGFKNSRWDIASAKFTIPEGISKLSVCVKPKVESCYRLDDLKLEVSSESGKAVDFAAGIELQFEKKHSKNKPNPEKPDPSNPTTDPVTPNPSDPNVDPLFANSGVVVTCNNKSSYKEVANVNGKDNIPVYKLGTSKVTGTAVLTVTKETKKITFFAVAWNKKGKGTLQVMSGEKVIGTCADISPNSGLAGRPAAYNLTIDTAKDKYTIEFAEPLKPGNEYIIATKKGGNNRVAFFGMHAE